MKYCFLVVFIFSSAFCFAQKKFTLTSDSVSVTYMIREDSLSVFEKVEITNLSQHEIFIPDIKNRDIYFFVLNNTLYSHLGVMTSKLGVPNLSLDVRLIKVLPKESYSLVLNIPKGKNGIESSYFSFDYVKSLSSKIEQDGVPVISMERYITMYKYAIGRIEGK